MQGSLGSMRSEGAPRWAPVHRLTGSNARQDPVQHASWPANHPSR